MFVDDIFIANSNRFMVKRLRPLFERSVIILRRTEARFVSARIFMYAQCAYARSNLKECTCSRVTNSKSCLLVFANWERAHCCRLQHCVYGHTFFTHSVFTSKLLTVTDSYKLGVAPHWLRPLARGARGHLKLDRNSVLRLKLCVVQPDKRSL